MPNVTASVLKKYLDVIKKLEKETNPTEISRLKNEKKIFEDNYSDLSTYKLNHIWEEQVCPTKTNS